jgi:iron complex transport system ATP-binding protein
MCVDMAFLEVENLRVGFGGTAALQGVSFAVGRGEFVALAGPNGAGKTTVLRAAAGLLDFEGAVRLEGRPLQSIPLARRARLVSYLPQGRAAHWPMTVRDIVSLGRLPHRSGLTRMTEEDQAAVIRAISSAGLEGLAGRRIDALSEGERARVMMARALAQGAPLLLADEPTAALDPYHQLQIMELLQEEARQGAAVIAVLHDLGLAEQFAGRVILAASGAVVADGAPAQVLTPERLEAVYRLRLTGEGKGLARRWSRVA